ncbi:MAG TPA: NADH-quinone oxidoreductase subunit H [Phycisphaerales bacterium]|nr:NADH-quinone oxidoreductase subunit H [Phycisphaerales bacterium]
MSILPHGISATQLFVSLPVLVIMLHVILITVAYLIYLERKICSYIQDRIGPNRVGFDFGLKWLSFLRGAVGLGQPLADGMKFMLKEDYMPKSADRVLFTLAPATIVIPAIIGFVIIPWGGYIEVPTMTVPVLGEIGGRALLAGANINVGVIYLLAVASLGVYGVVLGGWASNNKYSFLGGLRASAQMVSYEIPLGLSLMSALLICGTVLPMGVIEYQVQHGWLIFASPVAALLFFAAILAEANRAPFDNAEAEQELVGGYHTEYSSMRFALFFLAEYMHMVTSCAFFALVFLGGFHLPVIPGLGIEDTTLAAGLVKFVVYFGKVLLLISFMMLIRWTLPRLRYDQVMFLGWQTMIPLSLMVLVLTSVMVFYEKTAWYEMLGANIALVAVLMLIQPMLPKYKVNHRVPMYGSRFNPMPGERVTTAAPSGIATEDRPVEGSLPAGDTQVTASV